ncbi:MAG TPA: GAF domain-containing protein [Actinomycetota bacterium]
MSAAGLFGVLREAVREAVHAEDLGEALAAIAQTLSEDFVLIEAHVGTFGPPGTYRIVAVWPPGGVALGPGTELAADMTPDTRRIADELATGGAVMVKVRERDLGLVGDVLTNEDVASLIALPLLDDDRMWGVLSLGSRLERVFEGKAAFFTGLARGLEGRLRRLLAGAEPDGLRVVAREPPADVRTTPVDPGDAGAAPPA